MEKEKTPVERLHDDIRQAIEKIEDDVDDTGGSESVTLTVNQIPAHTHTHTKATHPSGSGPEQNQSGGPEDRTNFGDTGTTSSTGGGQSHENRPPYYALCYIMKT